MMKLIGVPARSIIYKDFNLGNHDVYRDEFNIEGEINECLDKISLCRLFNYLICSLREKVPVSFNKKNKCMYFGEVELYTGNPEWIDNEDVDSWSIVFLPKKILIPLYDQFTFVSTSIERNWMPVESLEDIYKIYPGSVLSMSEKWDIYISINEYDSHVDLIEKIYNEVTRILNKNIELRKYRRDEWRSRYSELSESDQLFIAV